MDRLYDNVYQSLERRDYAAAKEHIVRLAEYDAVEAARLLVSLYIEQGDSQGAMAAWQQLNLLSADFCTQFLHARILVVEKRYVSAYEELVQIRVPQEKKQGYGEKVANLLGQCCRMLGRSKEAAAAYKEATGLAGDWRLQALEYSNYLFNLHYSGRHSADFLRQQAAAFDRLFRAVQSFRHERKDGRKGRLRIGYLSPDFRRHVMLCFCYDLLTAYDWEAFAVYAYMLGPEDQYSRRLQGQVTGWRNLRGLPPQAAAQVIHADEIDILVDLAGHTKGNGLPIMAYKPAPVQISGIGYFASTGLKTVDYFFGDIYLDGDSGSASAAEFTEKLLVLPQSHFCYCPFTKVPLPARAAFQRNGYVTFGSFNNFAKVTDEVLAVWGKILLAVPDSHLLLKAAVFDGGEVQDYTLERLAKAGLPLERVECRGISADYLPEYGDMDIALDTFPYPGGGTSCDALYMGRPLITLVGGSHGERFGYSLLMNLGLGELAAFSLEEYVERAILLAKDPELLAGLQANLRHIMETSPLMDRLNYVRAVESIYADVWGQYEGT